MSEQNKDMQVQRLHVKYDVLSARLADEEAQTFGVHGVGPYLRRMRRLHYIALKLWRKSGGSAKGYLNQYRQAFGKGQRRLARDIEIAEGEAVRALANCRRTVKEVIWPKTASD